MKQTSPAVIANDDSYRNLGRATHCSIGFFILSISANSVQNAESQSMENNGFSHLGFFSLSLLYFFLGAGSLASTCVMNKVGVKYCMAIGAVFDCLWILCSIFPYLQKQNPGNPSLIYSNGFIYLTTSISSIFDGLGGAIQWVAQGKYIADCATEKNKGFFFSYFWAYYMASQIVGNFLAALVIRGYDQTVFYLTMACFSMLSCFIFLCLKDPITTYSTLNDEQQVQQTNSGQAQNSSASPHRNYNTMNNPSQNPFQEEQQSSQIQEDPQEPLTQMDQLKKDVRSVLRMLCSNKMLSLVPYIVWTGISLSIYTGLLIPIIVSTIPNDSENQQMMKSLFSMVSLGLGEIVGGFFIGQVIDKMGNKSASIINMVCVAIQTLVVILFLYRNKFSLMVFFMTFIWGFADSGVNTHISEILGFEFDNNSEPYSIFNLVQSFAVFLLLIIEAFIKTRTDYFIFIALTGVIGVAICAHSLKFEYKHDKLDILRKSVILETSMARESSHRQNEKTLNYQTNRQIVLDFEMASNNSSPMKSFESHNKSGKNISGLAIELNSNFTSTNIQSNNLDYTPSNNIEQENGDVFQQQ
eukprot:403332950